MRIKTKFFILSSLLALVFAFSSSLLPTPSYAGMNGDSDDDTYGYAYSSNAGWISFKSSEGASIQYGVDMATNGDLTGYAWSSNIGWISFDDNSGCPSGDPHVNLATGEVTGYAKALSWDGCIGLSGTTVSGTDFGVTFDSGTHEFSGWAYEGEVMGWISFNSDTGGGATHAVYGPGGEVLPPNAPTGLDAEGLCEAIEVTFNASTEGTPPITYILYRYDSLGDANADDDAAVADTGDTTTLIDTLLVEGATKYYRVGARNSANLSDPALSAQVVSATVPSAVDCDPPEDPPVVPPVIPAVIDSFTANPILINKGESCTLNWTISGANVGTKCTLYGPDGNAIYANFLPGVGTPVPPTSYSEALQKDSRYKLSCVEGAPSTDRVCTADNIDTCKYVTCRVNPESIEVR